jgi:Flp pilus assembly protein TadG
MRTTPLRHGERGVTLVVMALTIFLTLGMTALAIDYGMVKADIAEAQRAMDSAALAGASVYLNADPNLDHAQAAKDTAWAYAEAHTVGQQAVVQAEVTPVPDLVNNKLTVSFARNGMKTWFANTFGTSSFGITASATAHVEETNIATCVKPVAVPDIWNNAPNAAEDKNGNRVWDFKDKPPLNGAWDDGEGEQWVFNPGTDTYDPATTGYGTTLRDPYGSGYTAKVKDYGRQIMLTTFSPKDDAVSSMYYSWGVDGNHTSADSIAAAIRGNGCAPASLNTTYPAANGGKIGPIQSAWADLIALDQNARWNDATNSVDYSNAGAGWLDNSARVVVVGLYDPSLYSNTPNANAIAFVNLAKIWIDQRPCSGAPGTCKSPITGRFIGYVGGGGAPGAPVGTLVKRLVLIK